MSDDNIDEQFMGIAMADFTQQVTEFIENLAGINLAIQVAMEAGDHDRLMELHMAVSHQVQRLTIGTFPAVLQAFAAMLNIERARVLAFETAINEAHPDLIEAQMRMIRINAPDDWVEELTKATARLKAGVDEVTECRGHDH